MPNDKEFKTIEEQITILRSRGLTIANENVARIFLLHHNYYRISGYSLTLRKNDHFFPGTTFQNIVDIYHFDQELRHILLQYLEIIEVKMKSIYAYEFTKAHGATGYLNSSFFTSQEKYDKLRIKSESQKSLRLPHEAYLKHYINDLQKDIPLWAYVDLFTIADISILYSISELSVQKAVADRFGLTMVRGSDLLGKFMHSMTIIRNLCAHGSRLYNRLFEQKPSLNRKDLTLLRKQTDGSVDNAHLYGFLFLMKRLLSETEFAAMKKELLALTEKYPFVNLRYYGFRHDWREVL